MSTLFFYFLFLVLTADGLMVFLTSVVVYMLTGSIEYAGLSYAIWWLPRLILIPLIGRLIDNIGVRPLSIISDCIKIAGCLFLVACNFHDPLIISIAFGIVGSLVSIGNSQTMIAYEKIIAILSKHKEHHVNLMSRMDFLGMIIGPVVGMLLIDMGYKYILSLPCLFYSLNAGYFIFTNANLDNKEMNGISRSNLGTVDKKSRFHSLGFIMSTPIILVVIGLATGNNMFDGLVESSGAALIDRNMELPVKYFGFIDVAAGIFGVLGTYIYGMALKRISRSSLLLLGLFVIVIPSFTLILNPNSIWIFVICYALTIIGKVITGNVNRIIRIEVIPTTILASTSSIIVLLCQSVLPIVGILLFFFGGKGSIVYYLMTFSVFITLLSGVLLVIYMKNKVIEHTIYKDQ
ncbi:MFS transporter [Photorhabdus luminescens]|uniref:MFS transporter n=1 Tax=Photorhabdus luminescens TaxID=29488 RepID=UPI000B4DCC41|nr:MFS transporter [Photorhabdus luminescens]OWO81391.1 MFS transporter [Photorhabdus luminescens]